MSGFLKRFLGRRDPPAPKIDYGPDSADTWCAGDLAKCIQDVWHKTTGGPCDNPPPVGSVSRVRNVTLYDGAQYLEFDDRQNSAWNASGFQKLNPPKHEACETEFVELLQRIKRPEKVE